MTSLQTLFQLSPLAYYAAVALASLCVAGVIAVTSYAGVVFLGWLVSLFQPTVKVEPYHPTVLDTTQIEPERHVVRMPPKSAAMLFEMMGSLGVIQMTVTRPADRRHLTGNDRYLVQVSGMEGFFEACALATGWRPEDGGGFEHAEEPTELLDEPLFDEAA